VWSAETTTCDGLRTLAGGGEHVGNTAGVDMDGIRVGIGLNLNQTLSHQRQYRKVQYRTFASNDGVIASGRGTHGTYVSRRAPLVLLFTVLVTLWSVRLHAEEQSTNPSQSAVPWLSLDALSATRDRPLFAPNRHKPAPPSAVATQASSAIVAPQPQKPQFALVGIIVTSSETIVLLRDPSKPELVSVRSGDSLGHWQVLADSNYTAKLTDGKQQFTLQMFAEP
jgi:hypothetical protein